MLQVASVLGHTFAQGPLEDLLGEAAVAMGFVKALLPQPEGHGLAVLAAVSLVGVASIAGNRVSCTKPMAACTSVSR